MNTSFITSMLLLIASLLQAQSSSITTKFDDAVPVLNMGTFHMGFTNDARGTEFDEHNANNVKQVHEIARKIAEFKPTVILVETPSSYDLTLQKDYLTYLKDPKRTIQNPSEIELLAFEVGRLSGTQQIYGIDYKEGYNYRIAELVKNKVDNQTYYRYMEMLDQLEKKFPEDKMSVSELLYFNNHPDYLDMLININADILTHISSEGKAEGADEAAKFYHRNLVMYSNFNQIKLTKDDRVFILMGATHTAYFNMWIQRSPKYLPVDVYKYLK